MEAATQSPPETTPEATTEKKESKPRTATKYAVAVWDEETGTFVPIIEKRDPNSDSARPVFKPYEGFKREDVLQDLIAAEVLEADDDTGKTPWVLITPLTGARAVRGTVEVVKPKIGLE